MLGHVNNEDLLVIEVSKINRVYIGNSSKGNQIKWYKDNLFIKLNTWKWYEDISEVLVSHLLSFTNIDYFVKYQPCKIIEDGVDIGFGCYSYSFLGDDEQDITFYRLAKSIGLDISTADFDTVRDELSDLVGFDLKSYIGKCLCLDSITFNEDRHFNNLSVIRTRNGYRESPIYDNGLSCLADIFSYPLSDDLDKCLSKVVALPFNTDFTRQIKDNMITPILLDVNGFINSVEVETEEEKRAFSVIKEGLRRMRGIAWEEY